MPATVTIRLNDQVSPGLDGVQKSLEETGIVSKEAAAGVAKMTDAQRDQVKVIHEHQGSLLDFTGNAVQGLGVATAAWFQYQSQVLTLKTLYAPIEMIGAATNRLANNTNILARSGIRVLQFAPRFGSAVGRAIPILSGFTLGLAGTNALLARTGIEFRQAADATDEQKRRYQELKTEANLLNMELDRLATKKGIDLSSLGVSNDSNYERLAKARGEFFKSLSRPLGDMAAGAGEVLNQLIPIESTWQAIDAAATRGTERGIKNLGLLQKAAENLTDWSMGAGYSERAKQQEKFNETLEETRDNFSRLRAVQQKLESERKSAEQAKRIDSMKTLGEIDAAIQKEKGRVGQLAANRQFDANQQAQYLAYLQDLERQRTVVIQAENQKRLAIQAATLREMKAAEERNLQDRSAAMSSYLREIEAKYKEHQEILANQRAGFRDLEFAANREILNDTLAALEREGADADTLHYAKMQALEQERNQRIAAADSQIEREKILFDYEQRRLIEAGNFRRSQLKQQLDDEKAAAEQRLQIQKEAQDRAKQFLEGAGITGANILANQDPKQALAALQARRRQAALDEFNNSDRGKELSNASNFDSRANRRLKHEQRKVAKEAEIQAFRDARMGNLNPGEQQQAQLDAANQQISAMAKTGQYQQEVLRALAETVRTAAQQEATTESLLQQVEQLQNQSKAIGRNSSQNRQRAQRGSL